MIKLCESLLEIPGNNFQIPLLVVELLLIRVASFIFLNKLACIFSYQQIVKIRRVMFLSCDHKLMPSDTVSPGYKINMTPNLPD